VVGIARCASVTPSSNAAVAGSITFFASRGSHNPKSRAHYDIRVGASLATLLASPFYEIIARIASSASTPGAGGAEIKSFGTCALLASQSSRAVIHKGEA